MYGDKEAALYRITGGSMKHTKEKTKNIKKDFNPKDAIFVFSSFVFICVAIIFSLIVYDVLTIQSLLSFNQPIKMSISIVGASIGLIIFGILLALSIPSKYIDDANKGFQNYSVSVIFSFMFISALFEELLFRGIIQNLIFVFTESQRIAIITTTFLFLSFHIQYFKKPIMLMNIAVPSLVFGWIYVKTNNILAPFVVHFLMNFGITLLFKYNLIRVK
ncbi:CPBP family intramembrane glutamic endopeptidase [Filibacter tadaridae]|uniref:CAAX amino terminal protease self- immunity n=2 Tax=Filibacter tadaridae TaxID=2483811 RepID=A0A3P5XBK8_9BACL|nr:CAAX amino terminal protease self- immunity [Filibacter tadaridae]